MIDIEAIRKRASAVTECDIEHVYADRRALLKEVERLSVDNERLRIVTQSATGAARERFEKLATDDPALVTGAPLLDVACTIIERLTRERDQERASVAALGRKCSQLEADRERNARLVEEHWQARKNLQDEHSRAVDQRDAAIREREEARDMVRRRLGGGDRFTFSDAYEADKRWAQETTQIEAEARGDTVANRIAVDGCEGVVATTKTGDASASPSVASCGAADRCCTSSHEPPDTACRSFLAGANGRCAYCDHEKKCHPGPGATCEIGRDESGLSASPGTVAQSRERRVFEGVVKPSTSDFGTTIDDGEQLRDMSDMFTRLYGKRVRVVVEALPETNERSR